MTHLHVLILCCVGVLLWKYDITALNERDMSKFSSEQIIECLEGFVFGAKCIGTSSTSIPKCLSWFGHSRVFSILLPMYKH